MKTKQKLLPALLILAVIIACCIGSWLWYDSHVDRSGWAEKNGTRFYRDFHGDPVSGWLELGEDRYYFLAGGVPALHWQTIDGITYYFGDEGIMHTGWLEKDGKVHYFGGNGSMVVGWLWLEEGRYYLRDGALLTGWQDIDGGTCYFREDGTAALGFAEIDGNTYYFDEGFLVSGAFQIQDSLYYFSDSGIMQTGWQEFEGGRRYFTAEGPALMGWQELEGKRFYFDYDGYMAVGETEIEGRPYRFREDGSAYPGWEEETGRFFLSDGAMAVGVTHIDGNYYHFDENGQMTTGWQNVGEYRYYFHSDGTAATGPNTIHGQTHYFSPKGIEVVLVNGLNPVPDWYQLDPVNVVDYHDVDRLCYDALNRMLEDLTAAGIEYTFNSAYRTILEQTTILEYRTREHMANFKLDFFAARDKAYETVAIPGTSEHHLGLAVDLLGDEAVAWLTEHCWDYGFIVRYTEEKEGITGIVDEPWHFRYVGTEVSLDMKDSGLCLEEYLGAEAVDFEKAQALYGEELYQETVWQPPEKTQAGK